MKLKYYLRGLGVGIVLTSVIMSVFFNKPEKVEAIPVKDTVLSEMQTSTEDNSRETTESSSEAIQSEQESSLTETAEVTSEEITSEENSSIVPKEEVLTDETITKDNLQMIEVTVSNGDGSNHISKKLAEASLVESATIFDRYLCENGYDKKIVIGIHKIPVGATEEEIAKILCSKK